MSRFFSLSQITNGESISWHEVATLPIDELVKITAECIEQGARLCAWFAINEATKIIIVTILAYDAENMIFVGKSLPFSNEYPSLTCYTAQAHLFEREVFEQTGVMPIGHPWLKPVRKSRGYAPLNGEFFKVQGTEVHEVAVGPVHASIIEPGHFRFQCAGEEVLHLEIALGYQHRGVENCF